MKKGHKKEKKNRDEKKAGKEVDIDTSDATSTPNTTNHPNLCHSG